MARILGLMPSALRAARAGLTATEWYKVLRVQGVAPRQSEAYKLYSQAVSLVANAPSEIGAPQGQKPRVAELPVYPTKSATGVMQTVTLLYRNRTTGAIGQVFYRVTSEKGVTRSSAVKKAIESYAGAADNYDQEMIAAVHSSAYRMVPTGF
jgi:hypothetical protein